GEARPPRPGPVRPRGALGGRDHRGPRLSGHLDCLDRPGRRGRALRRLRAERETLRGGLALRRRRPRVPLLEPEPRGRDPAGGGRMSPIQNPKSKIHNAASPLVLPTWLVLGVFFLLPLTILFVISFAQRGTYGSLKPIDDFARYVTSGRILANYARSLHPIYLQIFWRSVWMAVVTTVLCLALSYPVAYYIAVTAPPRRRNFLLGLAVVPFWTS